MHINILLLFQETIYNDRICKVVFVKYHLNNTSWIGIRPNLNEEHELELLQLLIIWVLSVIGLLNGLISNKNIYFF